MTPFRKVMLALLAVALLATACDGHESGVYDQEWDQFDWRVVTNHGAAPNTQDSKIASYSVSRSNQSTTIQLDHRICIVGVSTYNATGNVAWTQTKCSPWRDTSGSGNVVVDPLNISGTTAEAFESYVEMQFYFPTIQEIENRTCEYHDPDASNPWFCPGHGADGQPS